MSAKECSIVWYCAKIKIKTMEEKSIEFSWGDEKPIMKIGKGKFYWKGEEVEDIHNVYERFNEWLSKAEKIK